MRIHNENYIFMICAQDLDKNIVGCYPTIKMFLRRADGVSENSYQHVRKKLKLNTPVKYKKYLLTLLQVEKTRHPNKSKSSNISPVRPSNAEEIKIVL